MTTLLDGTVVDESIDAVNFTAAADVPAVFGNGPRVVEFIGIHHWGALGQRFDDVVGFLASKNSRNNSAAAVIQSGRATSLVAPANASWAAGNAWANAKGHHLELRPEATDGDYITAAAYIHMLRQELGDIPLRPHRDFTQTACPGVWDLVRLDALARTFDQITPSKGWLDMLNENEQRDLYNKVSELHRDYSQGINGVRSDGDSFSLIRRIGQKFGVGIDEGARQQKYGKK